MEVETTPQYLNNDKNSFAWSSARERWPVILTQAIDDVYQSTSAATDPEVQAEGKEIVSQIARLKYEVQHDRPLTPLADDGVDDVALYNSELAKRGELTWLSAPWLYSECYMYRRMQTYFSTAKSSYWKSYDVFRRSKLGAFKSSRAAVVELAAQYKSIVTQLQESAHLAGAKSEAENLEAEKNLFIDMCEICLWGNKTDLSLLPNLSEADIKLLQGSKVRKAAEANILVNDIPKAFDVLSAAMKAKKPEIRVDIVLDNAGFELFVDLLLAGYLLAAGLATTVVLHPKSLPWFVSDVLVSDFLEILTLLGNPKAFFGSGSDGNELSDEEVKNLSFLFQHWATLNAEGGLIIRPNGFWTHGGSFWRLPSTAPDLYEDLKESELVIFKGDLNYRKLVLDAIWNPTTTFDKALGPLGGKSGVRILSLRTCKADVVVALPPGKDEELRASQGKDSSQRAWACTGQWAVCSFHDGK